MKKLSELGSLFKQTFKEWSDSDASDNSASLAYSAIFSMPGLLIIIIWAAGHFFGEEAIQGEITHKLAGVMGEDVARTVQRVVAAAFIDKQNFWMKAVGVASLVFGATNLFFQLQKFLNRMWGVKSEPKKALQKFVVDRITSLGMILVIAFLLLITLILTSIIGLLNDWITAHLGLETYQLVNLMNILISFAIVTLLFALMFKVLPDVKIQWCSVWVGAIVTSILFSLGKYLLGLYFKYSDPGSAFGAAGTLVLLMLWINYTCQLIFFGAAFTKVYAVHFHHEFKPSSHAEWADPKQKTVVDPKLKDNHSTLI